MTLVTAPDTSLIFTALRTFVLSIVPSGVEVVQGLDNRVPMPPASPGFVNMTLISQQRLRTNQDSYVDPTPTTGSRSMEQGTEITIQLDCYGADSAVWAAQLSTVLRDELACDALAPYAAPLYADDPTLAPLIDSERQYEARWIVGAVLQWNPATVTAQQFAATLDATLINVDEAYPP